MSRRGWIGVIGGGESPKPAKWPECVTVFPNDANGAKTLLVSLAQERTLQAWLVTKGLHGGAKDTLRGAKGRIIYWPGSLNELALHLTDLYPDPPVVKALPKVSVPEPRRSPLPTEIMEPPPMPVKPIEPPPQSPAESAPSALAPKWTVDEVDTMLAALACCDGSAQVFVAEFNDATSGRRRDAAELAIQLPRTANARAVKLNPDFLADLRELAHGRTPAPRRQSDAHSEPKPQPKLKAESPRPRLVAVPAVTAAAAATPVPAPISSPRLSLSERLALIRLQRKAGLLTEEEMLAQLVDVERSL